MRIALIIVPCVALGILLAVMAAGVKKGTNIFKIPAVAWMITGVMVVVAIGIGIERTEGSPLPQPPPPPPTPPPSGSFVWDDANALSDRTVRELDQRNDRLWDRHNITVAVVTCDNQRELGEYAYRQAEKMGLGGYDMVVALDIRGDNYWLLLGNDVGRDFPYDPSEYACEYMENAFVRRDYDDAVLELTKALEDWYGKQYR